MSNHADTTTSQEKLLSTEVQSFVHALKQDEIKQDQRGAHWRLKRNTNQSPKPGKWTLFWSEEEKKMKFLLQNFMRFSSSSFLQTFPWDLPDCPVSIGSQRKTIWMYLYLCHLKGVIQIQFNPEFYYRMLIKTSMNGIPPVAFEPTISQKTYFNSFFGIQSFNVIDLDVFNENLLFPTPSGYSDTKSHVLIGKGRALNRTFCKKAVIRTWHAMGLKETSPTRMEYDAVFSDRIKRQQNKQFAKRTATKALVALSEYSSSNNKRSKITHSTQPNKTCCLPQSSQDFGEFFFIFLVNQADFFLLQVYYCKMKTKRLFHYHSYL